MITQIYSLQTVEEAKGCVEAGVDYIGIAAGNNAGLPSEISLEEGKAVIDAVRGEIKCTPFCLPNLYISAAAFYKAINCPRPYLLF